MEADVVVVGHGLSAEGKGWGTKIDSCGVVVRMWNYHWQNPVDYGERYDYGFYEILPTEMARFYKHNCKTPLKGWWATRTYAHTKPYFGELPPGTEEFNSEPWAAEAMKMGGVGTKGRLHFTRGTRAAAIAMLKMQPGQSLILVAFDSTYARLGLTIRDGFPQVYVECPAGFPFRDYVGNVTKYGNHDYQVEKPFLEKVAERAKVKLLWSQEFWGD